MRLPILFLIAAALLGEIRAVSAQSPTSYPWCAKYFDSWMFGTTSCYFTSYEQCRTTMSGIGGVCVKAHITTGRCPMRRCPRAAPFGSKPLSRHHGDAAAPGRASSTHLKLTSHAIVSSAMVGPLSPWSGGRDVVAGIAAGTECRDHTRSRIGQGNFTGISQ
jgi:hypothetical protein